MPRIERLCNELRVDPSIRCNIEDRPGGTAQRAVFVLEGMYYEEGMRKIGHLQWAFILVFLIVALSSLLEIAALSIGISGIIAICVLCGIRNHLGKMARRDFMVILEEFYDGKVWLGWRDGMNIRKIQRCSYLFEDVDKIRLSMQELGVPFQARRTKSANKR